MTKKANVDVYNVPEYATKYRYWVARYHAGKLWFWSGFNDEERANEAADAEDGMVVEWNE